MKEVKHNGNLISYDEDSNKVFVNGEEDKRKVYSPSFVDNKDNTMTFIGFVHNQSGQFISLSGKSFRTINPDEVKL